MKKRWTAAVLALALSLALLPAPARAAAGDGSAGSRLTGPDREVYDYLRAEIIKVARGSRFDTDFRVPDLDSLSWSLEELNAAGGKQSDILAKLGDKFSQTLHMRRVYDCLAADLPYDLYWKDNLYSWDYTQVRRGDRALIRNLTVRIQVSQDYRGSAANRTSAAKITAANQAAKNARDIVAKYADKSDYEKLSAYREEICALTDYDTDTLYSDVPYGNPWQAVYVFDGDPDTNVVCEGYAKAFKYLCDLSDFDADVACCLVTGEMDGGEHMWNVVRMGDGQCYLVDLTNCDGGAIGADDKLFLTGASGSERTWTVDKPGCRVTYVCDDSQEGLYTSGWLSLSAQDYVEPEPGSVAITVVYSPFLDVLPEAYYAGAVAWAVAGKITQGTAQDAFSPDETCTHGQILTFLWRAAGEPAVGEPEPEEEYYAAALRWAAESDMLGPDFDPGAPCSRADAVRYIWCAFDRPDGLEVSFSDVPQNAAFAQAVGWAVEAGVTTGTSNDTFSPDELCSRGQIVTFLYRAYQ